MTEPTATYLYTPTLRKLRFPTGGPKDRFEWEHLTPDGWKAGANGQATDRLYGQVEGEHVAIVEGEKDVDSLAALAIPAVTSGNAKTWKPHHSAQLKDRGVKRVTILSDWDLAGEECALIRMRECLRAGLKVRFLRLADVLGHDQTPLGYDVSDYLKDHTREQLVGLIKVRAVGVDSVPEDDEPTPQPTTGKPLSPAGIERGVAMFLDLLKLPAIWKGDRKITCPFHEGDANPSLNLNLDTGQWCCFACRIGGGPTAFYVRWIRKTTGESLAPQQAAARMRFKYGARRACV